MPDGQTLGEALAQVRERIDAYRGQAIGEQNTKVGLIAPILRTLGWNVEDLREVHLEYRRLPANSPVDYALLIQGAPRLFIEAKALGENLDDRRWGEQVIHYAMVAGVKWVVLTDGDEYRIYNAHAEVPVEQKVLRRVRITDEATRPEETLALLSRENIAELEALWAEDFADRQVKVALESLVKPEVDEGFVRLLRRHLPATLRPQEIRAALSRLYASPVREPTAQIQQTRTTKRVSAKKRDTGPRPRRRGTPWSEVTLGDLISAGLLRPPVDLFKRYKGQDLHGRIEPDGRVSFAGELYGSISTAAAMARKSVIGAPPGRPYPQTNGWGFLASPGWLWRTDLHRRTPQAVVENEGRRPMRCDLSR